MNTPVNHRSYVKVLQNGNPIVPIENQGTVPVVHSQVRSQLHNAQRFEDRYTDCVPSKCVHLKHNVPDSVSTDKPWYFKCNKVAMREFYMQESPIHVQNR